MYLDALARKADEAKTALEVARTGLERTARRWAERQEASALTELRQNAEEFYQAQCALDQALHDWARALQRGKVRLASSAGAAAY
jgi:hypothetical protein